MKSVKTPVAVAVMAAGVLCAAGASAQGYVGIGVGQGHASIPGVSATVSGISVNGSEGKTKDTAYKLFLGYQYTPHWGLELGYNDLGDKYSANISATNGVQTLAGDVTAKIDNWYVAAVGTVPYGNGFSLFGKVGAVRNTTKGGDLCLGGVCASTGDTHHSGLFLGVGAEYAFTKQLGARLGYEDFGKVTNDDVWGTGNSGSIKANMWDVSVKYSF